MISLQPLPKPAPEAGAITAKRQRLDDRSSSPRLMVLLNPDGSFGSSALALNGSEAARDRLAKDEKSGAPAWHAAHDARAGHQPDDRVPPLPSLRDAEFIGDDLQLFSFDARSWHQPQAPGAGSARPPALARSLKLRRNLRAKLAAISLDDSNLAPLPVHRLQELGPSLGRGSSAVVRSVVIGDRTAAFKPMANMCDGDAAGHRTLASLATQAYDRALGFGLTLPSQLVALDVGGTLQVGLLMDLGKGDQFPWRNLEPASLRDPRLVHELVKLQLLDCLTGDADRAEGNYFLDISPDAVRLQAYDNDACFSYDVRSMRGVLPPIVTRSMADAVRAIDRQKLKRIVRVFDAAIPDADDSDGPAVSEIVLKSAFSRLRSVKAHLDRLEERGRIVDDSQWAGEIGRTGGVHADFWRDAYWRHLADAHQATMDRARKRARVVAGAKG